MNTYKMSRKAVSDVVGTAVLLGVAIIICSVMYYFVFSSPLPQTSPNVELVGTVIGENITIEHRGGDDLSLDARIMIYIDQSNFAFTFNVSDGLDDNSKKDGKWNIGEQFTQKLANFNYSENSKEAEIQIVDSDSNTMVMMGVLDIHPQADIGVKISVNETRPISGKTVTITITVTNYRSDLSVAKGIQVEYILPTGLEYVSSTASQGSYNQTIWDVGSLPVRGSATLSIIARVTAERETVPTQLVCILDGSTSISNSNWDIFTHGLADALKSSDFPHDGSVELTIIQFGGQKSYTSTYYNARIELGPSKVNDLNIADLIWMSNSSHIPQYTNDGTSYTPLSCGIRRANDFFYKSANYSMNRHVICLLTDGNPNCEGYYNTIGSNPNRWKIETQGTSNSDYVSGRFDAENARAESIDYVLKQADEFNVLVVKGSDQYNGDLTFPQLINWMQQSIIWPGNYQWNATEPSPLGPGWIRLINSWNDFPLAIQEMFWAIFNGISNTVEIINSDLDDPYPYNNQAPLPTIWPI